MADEQEVDMMEHVERWLGLYERGGIDRRAFLAAVGGAMAASGTGAQTRPGLVTPGGLHHVELKTLDLVKTTQFYERLLGPAVLTDERATIMLEPGVGRGTLRISRGPIPRVDHFAVKVPGMSAKDPKRMRARLEHAGLKVRQVEAALYVKGPDDLEVELVAPSVR